MDASCSKMFGVTCTTPKLLLQWNQGGFVISSSELTWVKLSGQNTVEETGPVRLSCPRSPPLCTFPQASGNTQGCNSSTEAMPVHAKPPHGGVPWRLLWPSCQLSEVNEDTFVHKNSAASNLPGYSGAAGHTNGI